MPHKFQYTLDLLRSVIHTMPGVFPRERHEQMDAQLTALEKDSAATQEQIEAFMVSFGKEIWPYTEAYEAYFRNHGEAKERETIRAKLTGDARKAFDEFMGSGGKVEDIRNGSKFETAFSPDVRAQVVQAELDSHDEVHDEMERQIAGEGAAEFAQLLDDHKKKLAALESKIAELRALAGRDEKWSAEILDKVKTFEQGFAYVERTPTVEDVAKEIQYYVDVMDVE